MTAPTKPEGRLKFALCPFCGLGGAFLNKDNETKTHWVECNCSARGPFFEKVDKTDAPTKDALHFWNYQRRNEDLLRQRDALLEAARGALELVAECAAQIIDPIPNTWSRCRDQLKSAISEAQSEAGTK